MKYIGQIFNVSDVDLGISKAHETKSNTHDVVVISHDRKNRRSKVCTLTSLVYFSRSNKAFVPPNLLSDMERGKIIPVPNSLVGDSHFSGFDKARPIIVPDNVLSKHRICKKSELDWRFVSLLK